MTFESDTDLFKTMKAKQRETIYIFVSLKDKK